MTMNSYICTCNSDYLFKYNMSSLHWCFHCSYSTPLYPSSITNDQLINTLSASVMSLLGQVEKLKSSASQLDKACTACSNAISEVLSDDQAMAELLEVDNSSEKTSEHNEDQLFDECPQRVKSGILGELRSTHTNTEEAIILKSHLDSQLHVLAVGDTIPKMVGLDDLSRVSIKGPSSSIKGNIQELDMEFGRKVFDAMSKRDISAFLVVGLHDCKWVDTGQEQAIAMHAEEESELKASPQHTLNYPPVSGRRSKQNLTEEEKEERRLCRVLANRESARQTIRRRQAMYEELTRKAADLASENECLKKQKELAAKEYDSLMNENTSLRIQIAQRKKAEAEEADRGSKSKPIEISTTSTAPAPTPIPTSLFNQSPITPFFWPSIVQPFNGYLLQCSTQNISGELDSINRQESSNPGNPLYVLPLPCLIPFHPQSNPFLPWSSTLTENHPETSSIHQCHMSYPNMEKNQAVAERDFLHEWALGFPPDGRRQPSGVHSREVGPPMTATSGQIDTPQQDNTPDINDTLEKTSQESTCSSKKSIDAIAATEARKRRRELLKFKGQIGSHD